MASTKTAPTLPSPASGGGAKTGGLRERKKQKTRESIQRTALRLFGKQGYEETTVEQIAAAAEISPILQLLPDQGGRRPLRRLRSGGHPDVPRAPEG